MEPEQQYSQPVQTGSSGGRGKCALITILVAIVFAGAAGGGVYYFMNQQAANLKSSSDSQIQNLQKQVDDLKQAAAWQTYNNQTYKFSFKYPSDWTVSEQKASFGDARQLEISFSDKNYYVTVFNIGSQTAEAFVKSFYGNVESGPSDIKNTTINNYPVVKFFMQHASTSAETIGSTNYFFSKNNIGVNIANSLKAKDASDPTLDQIVNSFAFLQ